jgi:hypothetical protein
MLLKVLLKVVKKEVRARAALLIRRLKVLVLTSLPTGSPIASLKSGPNSQIYPLLISKHLVKLRFYLLGTSRDPYLLTHSSSVEKNTI